MTSANAAGNMKDCIPADKFDAAVDYFPIKTVIQNSTLFSITYNKSYKVINNNKDNVQYVLTQCGAPQPDAALFANTTKFFTVPATKAATLSTPSNPFLLLLGLQDKLVYVDSEDSICAPCVQLALEKGTIKPLLDNSTLVKEQLATVDVVFKGSNDKTNNTVAVYETSDPGPLHRSGWIQFYAFFFNAEAESQMVFNGISNNYHCFANASALTLANHNSTAQTVAWTSINAPSKWNGNQTQYVVSAALYKVKLTSDAGAIVINQNITTNDSAVFLAAIKNVDVIIDETYILNSIDDMVKMYNISTPADFKFLVNKRVYREDGLMNIRGGRDWFESSVSYGDAVLQDLVRVVYPVVLPEDTKPLWFRNLATNESSLTMTSANCTNPNDRLQIFKDRVIDCSNMELNLINSSSSLSPIAMITFIVMSIALFFF
eukprot:gene9804-11453_t